MKDDKIVQRIKKIMNIAREGTIHEKEVALYQAQRLMAKHRISELDIRDNEKEEVLEIESSLNCRKETWKHLAQVIADNFRCRVFYRAYSKTRVASVFVGYEYDSEVGKEVFESAYQFAELESNAIASFHSRNYGTAVGVRDEYIVGFIEGLKKGFEDQIELTTDYSIMVVVPEEVNDHMACKVMSENFPKSIRTRRNGDAHVYRSGYNNGVAFSQNRKQERLD